MQRDRVIIRRVGSQPVAYLHFDDVSQGYLLGPQRGACVFSRQNAEKFVDFYQLRKTYRQETVSSLDYVSVDDREGDQITHDTSLECWRRQQHVMIKMVADNTIKFLDDHASSSPSIKYLMMAFQQKHTCPDLSRAQQEYNQVSHWRYVMLNDTSSHDSKLTLNQKQQLRLASEQKMLKKMIDVFRLLAEEWLDKSQFSDAICAELMLESMESIPKIAPADPFVIVEEECIICLDKQREHVYRPCNHKVSCLSCASQLLERSNLCPWCRCLLIDQ